jgi:hypothetical protein
LLFLIIPFTIFSQNKEDFIFLNEFEYDFFFKLLEEKINNERIANGLEPLKNDDILDKASYDHASYMLSNNTLSEKQKNKKKELPLDRVKSYGGTHGLVGENRFSLTLGTKVKLPNQKKKKIIRSYKDVVDYIFNSWNTNPINRKIFLNPSYYYIGTGIAFDKKTKAIYIDQLYANTPFEIPEGVEVNTKSWGIKPYNATECIAIDKKYDYIDELFSDNIKFKNGQIYFYYHDLILFKEIFSEPNDALAIDIVSPNQYKCGEPNKFFPSEVHKGIMLKPLNKSQLLSKNEAKKSNEVLVSFGPIPSFVDTNFHEFNLLVIKNGCNCMTILYNGFTGENMRFFNQNLLMDTVSSTTKADSVLRKLSFEIPFEKNKYDYEMEDIKPFLDSIELNKYNIKHIDIIAYSSIEGDVKANERLQKKRAESILKVIEDYQLENVKTRIITKENWDGFYESIKDSPYEKVFKGLSKDQIRAILNADTTKTNYEPYLEDQRKAKIIIDVESIFVGDELAARLPRSFNNAIKSDQIYLAKVYQTLMFHYVDEGKLPKKVLFNNNIPKTQKYASLNNNVLAFKMYFDTLINHNNDKYAELLDEFNKLLSISPKNPYLRYNKLMLRLLIWTHDYSKENNPQELFKEVKDLYKTKIENWKVNQLFLQYNLIAADYYYEKRNYTERERALKEAKKLLVQSNLNRDQIYKIANYFIFQLRIKWAIELMKPMAFNDEIDEDYLFKFIQIAMYDQDQISKSEFIQLMQKANAINPDRFCKLFSRPYMSIQLLEDPKIKKEFCSSCNH